MPRISQLPSLTTADNSDEIAIVDVSASVTKKITRGELLKAPLPNNAVTTPSIANSAVTASKIDFATYSTTEKVVGKWVDGKPIYRRVFNFTFPGSTQNISHGIGVDTPISVLINRGNQAIGAGVMHSDSEGYFIKFTDTNLEARVIGTPSAFSAFAILEYTKV